MSAVTRNQVFSAVHTVGGLLPADMLLRISEGKDVKGSAPADYRVIGSRSVRDDAERHWDYLKSIWTELRQKLPVAPEAEIPADPTGVALSQWLEPFFTELGFGDLTAIGKSGIPSDDASKTFAISHRWNHVPIHLCAWNTTLDRRSGGAGTIPSQSLVQECLNRTDSHLWGVLTNGRQLRLLRDSSALATASYIEFDLEAIFDGELFSEFVLLYRLLHVTRFKVEESEAPSACWLEKWRADAITSGMRALDQLRKGVQEAITALGTGFLRHPANAALRENVDVKALHNALLRLAYRMLFLFVAEDRDALHAPTASKEARQRYDKYFSSARLRSHARRRRGTVHSDLYQALRIVLDALGDERGRRELGLPGLGGIFDETEADALLKGLLLSNEYLLSAVRHLSEVRDAGSRRRRSIDYRHLDAEELGSVYESLLELVPRHSAVDRTFELVEIAGNSRKTTGSYYTPSSLIECLLDSSLDPVIDDAVKRGEQTASAVGQPDPTDSIVRELLSLTICDPACGSGHFLVAAARRIAKRVAAVRERNPEPTIDAVRRALHEVIARCIYGVDLNPMAVELAKVSLWLEALEPGKPLSFLDAHIKCGNALIGATPALMRAGIPDQAFIATEGDDKKHAKALEKLNGEERQGQFSLFDIEEDSVRVTNAAFASSVRRIAEAPSDNLRDVRDQATAYTKWEHSSEYVNALHLADAWCAAFMWIKKAGMPTAVTHRLFRSLEDPEGSGVSQGTHDEIVRLRNQYRFFHWHLEFPEVFTVPEDSREVSTVTGWVGGFDCVLGNPPWDSVELKEQEFFAQRMPAIAAVGKANARKKLIAKLQDDPHTRSIYNEYSAAKRAVHAESHFLRRSARVPLTGQGNLNTYAVFAETARILMGSRGRTGIIVPTGIATDARTQYFFKDLVQTYAIAALFDFENAAPLFPDVHRSFKFSILSLAGRQLREPAATFAFFLRDPVALDDPNRAFMLTAEEISLLNPNTGTCPIFRSRRDAELTLKAYQRFPALVAEGKHNGNPWKLSFAQGLFNMSHDSDYFHLEEELQGQDWSISGNTYRKENRKMLPLYEAKLIHHYDHRWATYDHSNSVRALRGEEKRNPIFLALSRYWVAESEVSKKLNAKDWGHDWLCGWRDVCRATDERTAISAFIPRSAVGDKIPLMYPMVPPALVATLLATQSSLIFDYLSRQKIGGTNMAKFIWQQLPTPTPDIISVHTSFIVRRVLELVYTAYDMTGLARDLGDSDEPFQWDEERRAQIRAELDAYFFHLYAINRSNVDYIMESFQSETGGLKNNEIAKYGTYRTKNLVLAEYDRMAAAGVSLETPLIDGENFVSTLIPAPGHGPRHPARGKMGGERES
ncbi:SAM-dependent DNA methyltransferase [Nonomuraea sp. MG754425]|uniref:Eco57I restriction-modification methylase domain-containing protein n=1 Tax=Nonomuraea sp. MG754425 TaxID=2570319 RepID=UPI001F0165B3|nr:DNA methyltransferase [Nonomuraea sp. MG754425]MCF6473867.1 SAM-dependent DNA methyltransferase [Nonomuraea sp. MG754425]